MASEHPGETTLSVNLPESLSEWLDDRADAEGLSREDVLLQLLSAYHGVDDGDAEVAAVSTGAEGTAADLRAELADVVDERLTERDDGGGADVAAAVEEALDERLDGAVAAAVAEELDDRPVADAADLSDLEERFVGLVDDVRERVVQVKREADAKAPADHEHAELRTDLAALEEDLAALEELSDEVEALSTRVDAGFDNFEDVLSYLTESVDELSARQTTLARALVETREELRKLASRDAARSAAEDLKREANREGVRTADCGECGTAVDVGLLTRAQCPHCSSSLTGVEAGSGFFGTDTLETGSRPALEGGPADADHGFEFGVEEIIEDDPAEGEDA
jgi:predicted Zn-ribbon and HTH transcriptional regulator